MIAIYRHFRNISGEIPDRVTAGLIIRVNAPDLRSATGLLFACAMARIQTMHKAERTVVVVTGRLTAADMGRLEHCCSPALTSPALPLEIDLRGVIQMDDTATAVLRRLTDRGAVVTINASEPCQP